MLTRHTHTHTWTQSCTCVVKLTQRTCRATAPSVLSLCVNRSVGNSCRAERDRHIRLEQHVRVCICVRVIVCVCVFRRAWCKEHTSNVQQRGQRCEHRNPLNSCVLTRILAQRAPCPSVCDSLTALCQGPCLSMLPRRATRIGKWKKWALGGRSGGQRGERAL